MSKTITAAAVLQLVEIGRIGLDDPVDRHLGSLPYSSRVTVRQLISHTSGIPNPIPLRWVHSADLHETFDEDTALAAVLRKYPRLSFAPGSKYAYSNIGYWLLGRVVERTFAWLNQFRRLRVRYDKREDIHEAFLSLACALICWHALRKSWTAQLSRGAF
jgi:hypothetical protein